jgi:DNA-binding transcriptional regulator YhcF (GntR family)
MKNNLDESKPIYLQIKENIADAILNSSLKAGERIPSTNELARFYKINPATARQGMNELVMEQILQKRRGVGMFVTEEAKGILIENRKELFYRDFILPLKSEAKKLAISEKQIITLLEREAES